MARRRGTGVNGKNFSPETVEQVWEKGRKIKGKNPSQYRRDECGHVIYKASYGKESEMGWEIDHKHPVAKGGTDALINLRPLQSLENAKKGDTYPWNC